MRRAKGRTHKKRKRVKFYHSYSAVKISGRFKENTEKGITQKKAIKLTENYKHNCTIQNCTQYQLSHTKQL
jgi:hypothetical protein